MSDWVQTALFADQEVFEFTLKIGVIPTADHMQWWIEAKDPRTNVLLAESAAHHRTMADLQGHLERATSKLKATVEAIVSPF